MHRKNLRTFTLLVGSTLTVMAGAVIAPALPEIRNNFAFLPQAEMLTKLILTLPALVIALLSPVAGMFVDRWGRRKILLFSLLLYAFAGTTGAWLSNIYHILAGRILLGVAVGGIITAVITLIGDYFSGEQRSRMMGFQASFAGLGGLVFITSGGFLADFHWRYPFLIYAASLLVFILAFFSVNEPQNKSSNEKNKSFDGELSKVPPGVYSVFIIAIFSMAVFYMIPVQMPFMLSKMEGVSNTGIGLAISFMNVSSVFSSFNYSRIKKRLNFLTIMALVYFLVFMGYLVISQSNTYFQIISGIVISGFGFGLMMANLNLWLVNLAPIALRGRMVGYLNSSIFMGMFISPVLLQPIVWLSTLQNSFLIVSIILLVVSAVFFLFGIREKV